MPKRAATASFHCRTRKTWGGPLARSVIDLAIVLDATIGADPADSQTQSAASRRPPSYTAFLREGALDGIRLGILRAMFDEEEIKSVVEWALEIMKARGAEAIDIEVPHLAELLEGSGVINMEFKQDFEAYLRSSGAPVQSLADILSTTPSTDMRLKKRIVRTLVEEIVADVNEAGDTIEAVIHWKGGIHSTRNVRKNTTGHRRVGAEKTAEILAQMAGRFSDEDIALTLNRVGIRTSRGLTNCL